MLVAVVVVVWVWHLVTYVNLSVCVLAPKGKWLDLSTRKLVKI